MGGDCLNVGCVPSKCVIRSSRVVGELRGAPSSSASASAAREVDFAAVMERMRRLRARISANDSAQRFADETASTSILGDGALHRRRTRVEVGGQTLRFKRAVIATGARAAEPPIPGLGEAGYLTNETVFSLTERPRAPGGDRRRADRLRAGAGVPAPRLRGDAAATTRAHILNREDADAAEIVQRAVRRDGVRLVLAGARSLRVRRDGARQGAARPPCRAARTRCASTRSWSAPAARRTSRASASKPPASQYDPQRGVQVDDHLRTTNPRIFAAGDVCMDWKFTHAADFAARIVIQNALFFGRKRLSALHMPWCTYTDPEIAHVGLYEREAAQARHRGRDLRAAVRRGRPRRRRRRGGRLRQGARRARAPTQILGATIVARHAGEMISEITPGDGRQGRASARSANVIHPYPTQAEAIRQLGDAYNRTRLTPTVKRLFSTFLRADALGSSGARPLGAGRALPRPAAPTAQRPPGRKRDRTSAALGALD